MTDQTADKDEKRSWRELASSLGLSVSTLTDVRYAPGAPVGYSREAWRAFLEARAKGKTPGNGATDLLPGTCSYDAAVAAGQISYADAKIREAVVGEQIANDTKRGLLVTKETVKERINKITGAYLAALGDLPDIYAATLTPDQRAAGRKLARDWIDRLREKFSSEIRAASTIDD